MIVMTGVERNGHVGRHTKVYEDVYDAHRHGMQRMKEYWILCTH